MPQFQVITIGIICAAIFVCWLVFSGSTFNVGLTPFIAISFLIASLAFLFWVFFTPKGKTFARKYNQTQQHKASVLKQITSNVEAFITNSNFPQLMNEFKRLSTFSEVANWDALAEDEIYKIISAIQKIDAEITQHEKLLGKLTVAQYKAKYKTTLENMAEKLQESIDFTPNSLKEQKSLLKELRQQKKELQLQKREVAATIKDIQANARKKSTYAGQSFLGIYNSKLLPSRWKTTNNVR